MEKGGKVGKSAKSWKYGEKLEKGENVGNSGSKVIYAGGGLSDWFMGDWPVPRNGTLLALDRKSLTFYA